MLLRRISSFVGLITLVTLFFLAEATAPLIVSAQTTACTDRASQPGEQLLALQVGDSERDYLQFLPTAYDGSTPLPVVVVMHGFTDNVRGIRDDSQFNEVAEANDFIVVYPQGQGFPPRWNNGISTFQPNDNTRDVDFLRSLVTHLDETLCIDSSRVYVAGFSAGGGMAHRAACELSDIFAAAGTVSGAYSDIPGGCNPTRPVPIITLHGSDDRIVPYTGDDSGMEWLPDIGQWVAEWAEHNQCDETPITLSTVGDVSGIEYTNCAEDASVVFYTIDGGGHNWPGDPEPLPATGYNTHDINASEAMWQFFSQFSLTAEQP